MSHPYAMLKYSGVYYLLEVLVNGQWGSKIKAVMGRHLDWQVMVAAVLMQFLPTFLLH